MRQMLKVDLMKEGDIIIQNGEVILVKYIDIGPKMVYVKAQGGKQLSFPVDEKVNVMRQI